MPAPFATFRGKKGNANDGLSFPQEQTDQDSILGIPVTERAHSVSHTDTQVQEASLSWVYLSSSSVLLSALL